MHKQTESSNNRSSQGERVLVSFDEWKFGSPDWLCNNYLADQGREKKKCSLGQQQPNGKPSLPVPRGRTDGRTDGRTHGQDRRWRAGWRARRGEEELAALLLLTTFRQKEKLKIKDSKKKWIWRFSVARSAKQKIARCNIWFFIVYSRNIKVWLNICTLILVYSQNWRNIARDDRHFLSMIATLAIKKNSSKKHREDDGMVGPHLAFCLSAAIAIATISAHWTLPSASSPLTASVTAFVSSERARLRGRDAWRLRAFAQLWLRPCRIKLAAAFMSSQQQRQPLLLLLLLLLLLSLLLLEY